MTRCQTAIAALLGALFGTMGVAGEATAVEVQQPVRSVRVAAKMSTFFTDEILSSNYDTNKVLLEHPSNPKSMRAARQYPAIVQAATSADEIPTRHLFDDSVKERIPEPAIPAVSSPPGADSEPEDEITPISAKSPAPSYTDPWPAQASQSVTTEQPVTISNSVSNPATGGSEMGPGCS